MSHDPYRDPQIDPAPYRDQRDPNSASSGAAILLGAVLLAAIGAFIYFYTDAGEQVATNDMRPPITQPSTTGSAPAPETTGSSSNIPAAPEQKAEPRVKPVE